jgi:hypothetical protein
VLRRMEIPVLPCQAPKVLFCVPAFPALYLSQPFSQRAQPGKALPPKYDLHIQPKNEEVVAEVNPLSLGTGKGCNEYRDSHTGN